MRLSSLQNVTERTEQPYRNVSEKTGTLKFEPISSRSIFKHHIKRKVFRCLIIFNVIDSDDKEITPLCLVNMKRQPARLRLQTG